MRSSRSHIIGALLSIAVGASLLEAQVPRDTTRRTTRDTTPDTTRLQGVIVTATRIPMPRLSVPASVSVITGEELQRQGITRLSEALQQLPGVAVVQSGSVGGVTSLFVRGGQSNYVKVLVDGVPVNSPGGAIDLAHLTVDNIERIEIVRGAVSVLYGSDAISGVVQIFTKRGAGATHFMGSGRAGTFGTKEGEAQLSGAAGMADYSVAVARHATEGALPFNNRYWNNVVSGTLGLYPERDSARRSDARLSIRYHDAEYHFPTSGTGALVDSNQFRAERRLVASVDAGHFFTRVLESRVLLASHDVSGINDNQPDSPADTTRFYGHSESKVYRRSADARVNLYTPSAGILASQIVTVGAALEREHEAASGVSQFKRFPPTTSQFTASRRDGALYAQLVGSMGSARSALGALSYTLGGRHDDNETFGTFTTYRVAGVWRLPTDTRLRGARGTAFKEPAFIETFTTSFSVGNANLRPERSTSWEVGVEQDIAGSQLVLGAAYFEQRFRDLIQFVSSADRTRPNFFNVAGAKAFGVELEGRMPNALGVSLAANYTYLRTEVTDSGFGGFGTTALGKPLLRRPKHSVGVNVGYRVARLGSVNARIARMGSREDLDFSTFPATRVVLPWYTKADIAAEVGLVPDRERHAGLALTVRLDNALDARYEPVKGFPAPGRTVLVGGRIGVGQ